MLIFFLVIISAWTILILFATFQDIRQRLNPEIKSSRLSGLSLIDNFKILTKIDDKKEKHQDKYQLFDYWRGHGHVSMLIFHYLGVLLARENQGELAKENPPFVGFFFGFFIKATFSVFFTLNGIAAGKWFFRMFKSKTTPSTTKLILRFFFERFIMFAPIFYLFIVFYLVYVKYWIPERFYDDIVVNNCYDSFITNLLFASNFISTEKIVNHRYTVLPFIILLFPVSVHSMGMDFNGSLPVNSIDSHFCPRL